MRPWIRVAGVLALVMTAGGAPAQTGEGSALVTFKVLTPETALAAAQGALEQCRAEGFQVGVSVVDRFGAKQVFLRDRFAGPHVEGTSFRKAWTAVSFRTDTTELDGMTMPEQDSYGVRFIEGALPLGGGMLIREGDGSIVGAIGVSGAPEPGLDDTCAAAGIAAIADRIAF